MRRASWVAAVAVVLAVLGLSGVAAAAPSAHLDVGTDGSIGITLSLDDPNGSALRYAIDGNFTPIVSLIPGNASSRASVLAQIQTAESSPFLAGLFGNRDGTVTASEVTMFETLLRDEAGTLPSGTLTGGSILRLTLNGQPAGSAAFAGVTFDGAVGPDSSTAPVTVTSSTTDQFLPEGTTGTVAVSWNFSAGGGPLAVAVPSVALRVTTPAGTSITSTTGWDSTHVTNDLLGYGPATADGTVGATPTGTATVAFHPAFPLGDVLLGVGVAAVVGVVAFVLWRRRGRKAQGADHAPRG
jgi:hypothetical protein